MTPIPPPELPSLEQVLAEPAGRRLDVWVAEHIMRWRVYRPGEPYPFWTEGQPDDMPFPHMSLHAAGGYHVQWSDDLTDENVWSPSACIRDAWQVVEKVGSMALGRASDGHCWAMATETKDMDGGDSMPLAVCRAALLSVIPEEPTP